MNVTESPRMREPEVRKILGISRTYLYSGMRSGIFPARFRESVKFSYWLRSEVLACANGEDWRSVRPDEPVSAKTLDGRDMTRRAEADA